MPVEVPLMPPRTFRDTKQFFAALAAMAEEVRHSIIPMAELERMQLVTRIVNENDMVFGVWSDPDEPEGLGIQVIKGESLMPPLDGFELAEELSVAAIPCVGLEQAIAARDAWGRAHDDVKEEAIGRSARVALSVAEVARFVWIAGRRSEAGDGDRTDRCTAAGGSG